MTTNNNNRVPELRFPGFTGEWVVKRFGDIVKESKNVSTVENEDILLTSSIDGMFLNSEVFSHQRGQSTIGYRKIKKRMLVLSAQNLHLGNANVNMRYDSGLVSPAYKVYDIIGCLPEFMAQWIKKDTSKQFFFNATTQGASGCRRNVVWEDLYKQTLLVPTLAEQQKIADCLSSLDEEIAAEAQKADALKDHKKGLMQQLFPAISNEQLAMSNCVPKLRFSGFTGSWEVKKLGEVANLSKGKGIAKSDIDIHGQTPCIRYGELYTRYGEQIKTVFSRTNIPSQDLVLGKVNDVIIPSSGETHEDIATASCILVPGVAIGGDINILRTPLNGLFLSYYLNSAKKHEIAHIAQGDAVVHLYGTQLSKLSICFPPTLAEQQKIADCLSELDEMISAQQQKVEALKEHKKGLMQKLFPKM